MQDLKIVTLLGLVACNIAFANCCFVGADAFQKVEHGDTVVYEYEHYIVFTIPFAEDTGEKIFVQEKLKKQNIFSLSEPSSFFAGLVDSILLIDFGTSTMRNLSVHNLKTKKSVEMLNYVDEPKVQLKKLIYPYPLMEKAPVPKPPCPKEKVWGEQTGWVELMALDLVTFRSTSMKSYYCRYFE